MEISCAFATGLDTPDHIVVAEQLGYKRAWCYDSPALYPDVWMTLGLAATRTSRIELGPGVLIPSLRHVITNAAAVATLVHLAPGRVMVAVGSGFTGRRALGQKPLSWAYVRRYILALKALLRGEEVEWDGTVLKLLHVAGFAPPRPISVPILVGTAGPKSLAVAREVADGVFGATEPGWAWAARLHYATVLDDGEAPDSPRAVAAVGHAAAVMYHGGYERGDMGDLPRSDVYKAQIDAIEPRRRHLTVHEGHLVAPTAIDQPFVTGELLAARGLAGNRQAQRERLDRLTEAGVTEVAYQPAGPDIPGELRRFAEMAELRPTS